MKKRLYIILYAMGILAILLMAFGCGPMPADWEKKMLKPFNTVSGSVLDDSNLEDGTVFSGTLEVLSVEELKILAPEDFSGNVVGQARVTMTLKISKSKEVTQGKLEIRVRDREAGKDGVEPYFYYDAAKCPSKKVPMCGSFLKDKLNVKFGDGVGTVELKSSRPMSDDKELFGFVTVDGHATKLGEFSLKMERSVKETETKKKTKK